MVRSALHEADTDGSASCSPIAGTMSRSPCACAHPVAMGERIAFSMSPARAAGDDGAPTPNALPSVCGGRPQPEDAVVAWAGTLRVATSGFGLARRSPPRCRAGTLSKSKSNFTVPSILLSEHSSIIFTYLHFFLSRTSFQAAFSSKCIGGASQQGSDVAGPAPLRCNEHGALSEGEGCRVGQKVSAGEGVRLLFPSLAAPRESSRRATLRC